MTAAGFSQLLLLALACLVGACGVIVAFKRPWWAVVATIASLALLPMWVGVPIGPFFVTGHLALALVSIVSVVASRPQRLRIHVADLLLLGVLILSAGMFVLGLSNLHQAYEFFQWLVAYAFARVASGVYGLRRVFTAVTVVFTTAAVAIVTEWATGTNLWTTYLPVPNGLYDYWSTLQFRGGVLRAEGAFGHSIAAGACLAIAAILTLQSHFRPSIRLGAVAILGLGVLATLSRVGMVTIAIGLILGITLARTSLPRTARLATLGVLALGGVAFLLSGAEAYAESGAEAETSASYRVWLLDLIPTTEPFGLAASYNRSTQGGSSFGDFASIDNALLLVALRSGWVPLLILVGLLVGLVVRLLNRQVGVASAAVVSLIPALASVAFLTQYATVFWVTVGLAVTELVEANTEHDELEPHDQFVVASRLGRHS